jgi:minimal PKS acyl carrier protein
MAALTLDDLTRILEQDVGRPDVELGPAILDVPFNELGYDSLAMLQVAAALRQRHGVALSDGVVFDRKTPRSLIDYVNGPATSSVADA